MPIAPRKICPKQETIRQERVQGANFTRLSLLTSSPFQRDHSVKACVSFARPRAFVQRSSLGWRRSTHRRLRKANLKIKTPPPPPPPRSRPLELTFSLYRQRNAARERREIGKKREEEGERKARLLRLRNITARTALLFSSSLFFFFVVRDRETAATNAETGRGGGGGTSARNNYIRVTAWPRLGWLACLPVAFLLENSRGLRGIVAPEELCRRTDTD